VGRKNQRTSGSLRSVRVGKPVPGGYAEVMDAEIPLPPELERFWRTDDGMTAVERAEAYGIDISLLDDNLRLTPAERVNQNDRILNEAEALRKAYRISRERTEPHHAAIGGV